MTHACGLVWAEIACLEIGESGRLSSVETGRKESVGFEGGTGNAVLMRVVEIGALNRCGDIIEDRAVASRALESTGFGDRAGHLMPRAAVVESAQVLQYLTGKIGHVASGT
ncbi:MAG: hypothetical protein NTZ77_03760 [Caldiserica bacterium]|nr:hypothetical protein [Caldisericota bacterium]